jgi:hypothetical protein
MKVSTYFWPWSTSPIRPPQILHLYTYINHEELRGKKCIDGCSACKMQSFHKQTCAIITQTSQYEYP